MLWRIRTQGRPKIFYGWYIIGVAMLGAFLGSGSSQFFMSIMLKPLSEELGGSRTAITGAITAGTLLGGFLSPLIGRLVDRYGARPLTTLGGLAAAVHYFAMSNLSQLWEFYVVYVIGRAITSETLGGVVPTAAATNWFRRMRGRAIGLVMMCIPLGGSALTLIGQFIMDSHGWRAMFVVFGVVTLVLLVVPAWLVMRRRPEDMGLLPDGDQPSPFVGSQTGQKPREEEYSWTLSEAVRTPTLWLLIAAQLLGVMANTSVSFHQVAYYTDMGIPATSAVAVISLYALAGAVAMGVWGLLTEHFSERHLAVLVTLLAGASIFYLSLVRSLGEAILFGVLFGLTSRGEGSLLIIILAQYYGRRSYGTISGFVNPFKMVGLGMGPLVASITFDLTGSYHMVFIFFGTATLLVALLLWLAKKPTPRPVTIPRSPTVRG